MKRKSINVISLVLVLMISFFSLIGCSNNSDSKKEDKNANTNTIQNAESNNSATAGGIDNSLENSQGPLLNEGLKAESKPGSESKVKTDTINKIGMEKVAETETLAPAVDVKKHEEYRNYVVNTLAEGGDIAINLQGDLSENNIADITMDIIDTSGYAGYISGIKYSIKNNVAYIKVEYIGGKASYMNKIKAVDSKVNEIIGLTIKPDMTDFEKELVLHDYLVNNANYDYENYLNDTLPNDSFTAYGALINKVAVCGGYAEAMYKLLNGAGVKSFIIVGEANGVPHAWNLVNIEGGIYHLDATYDDPVTSSQLLLTHNYFNMNDDQISKNHSFERSNYIKSDAVAYNYFNYYKLEANNKSRYYELIKKGLTNKNQVINIRTTNYEPNIFNYDVVYQVIRDNKNKFNYVDTSEGIGFDYEKESNVITIIIKYYE